MAATSQPSFHFCDIEGGRTAFGGVPHTGLYDDCFDEDPLFAGPFDYHITWGNFPSQDSTKSSCIDSGNPLMIGPDSTSCDVGVFFFDQIGVGISDTRYRKSEIDIECWPNPSSGISHIRYSISDTRRVLLAVYDINGRQITVLADGVQYPGIQKTKFTVTGLPNGLYLIRLDTGNASATFKLLVSH